jgi:hypothetical protein
MDLLNTALSLTQEILHCVPDDVVFHRELLILSWCFIQYGYKIQAYDAPKQYLMGVNHAR